MDSLTLLIKQEIKRQYKSVRNFCIECDIAYSTLSNSLSNGVGNTSYNTVIKILSKLGLSGSYVGESSVLSDKDKKLSQMYNQLDFFGKKTVDTVIEAELERCTQSSLSSRQGEIKL